MEKKKLYTIWKESFKAVSETLIQQAFETICKHYEKPERHYHNLSHVAQIIKHINLLELIERDRLILIYSAFYHDVIYRAGSKRNEIKSAELAIKELKKLKVEPGIISSVKRTILATENHYSKNELTQLFLDIDMSILASNKISYKKYCIAIRKENARFPAFIYRLRRIKFIKQTLKRSAIFLTELYKNRYELMARENLKKELSVI